MSDQNKIISIYLFIIYIIFTGLQCGKPIRGFENPCSSVKCQNGGICQAVKSTKKQQYHPKCICPKHRAGLHCERPNMCVNHCLNRGRCVYTADGTVSCICPFGLTGSRCERKDTSGRHR